MAMPKTGMKNSRPNRNRLRGDQVIGGHVIAWLQPGHPSRALESAGGRGVRISLRIAMSSTPAAGACERLRASYGAAAPAAD